MEFIRNRNFLMHLEYEGLENRNGVLRATWSIYQDLTCP